MYKNKNKIIFGIIILLIIALGICVTVDFTKSDSNKKSRDIDVIDIECDDDNCEKEVKPKDKKEDNSKKDNTDNSTNNNSSSNTNTNINGNNSTVPGNGDGTSSGTGSGTSPGSESSSTSGDGSSSTTPVEDEDFTVSDNYQVWKQQTDLNIFNVNSVSPGDNGTYEFMINNNTSKNVKYNLVFDEENEYNINLRYKLKRNNKYIAGESDWVKYNDLNLGEKVLNSRKNDIYTIEWKWVDAANDTTVGRTPDAKYRFKINIKAMETGEIDTSGSDEFNPYTGDNIMYYVELALLLSIILLLLIIIKDRQKDEYEGTKCN